MMPRNPSRRLPELRQPLAERSASAAVAHGMVQSSDRPQSASQAAARPSSGRQSRHVPVPSIRHPSIHFEDADMEVAYTEGSLGAAAAQGLNEGDEQLLQQRSTAEVAAPGTAAAPLGEPASPHEMPAPAQFCTAGQQPEASAVEQQCDDGGGAQGQDSALAAIHEGSRPAESVRQGSEAVEPAAQEDSGCSEFSLPDPAPAALRDEDAWDFFLEDNAAGAMYPQKKLAHVREEDLPTVPAVPSHPAPVTRRCSAEMQTAAAANMSGRLSEPQTVVNVTYKRKSTSPVDQPSSLQARNGQECSRRSRQTEPADASPFTATANAKAASKAKATLKRTSRKPAKAAKGTAQAPLAMQASGPECSCRKAKEQAKVAPQAEDVPKAASKRSTEKSAKRGEQPASQHEQQSEGVTGAGISPEHTMSGVPDASRAMTNVAGLLDYLPEDLQTPACADEGDQSAPMTRLQKRKMQQQGDRLYGAGGRHSSLAGHEAGTDISENAAGTSQYRLPHASPSEQAPMQTPCTQLQTSRMHSDERLNKPVADPCPASASKGRKRAAMGNALPVNGLAAATQPVDQTPRRAARLQVKRQVACCSQKAAEDSGLFIAEPDAHTGQAPAADSKPPSQAENIQQTCQAPEEPAAFRSTGRKRTASVRMTRPDCEYTTPHVTRRRSEPVQDELLSHNPCGSNGPRDPLAGCQNMEQELYEIPAALELSAAEENYELDVSGLHDEDDDGGCRQQAVAPPQPRRSQQKTPKKAKVVKGLQAAFAARGHDALEQARCKKAEHSSSESEAGGDGTADSGGDHAWEQILASQGADADNSTGEQACGEGLVSPAAEGGRSSGNPPVLCVGSYEKEPRSELPAADEAPATTILDPSLLLRRSCRRGGIPPEYLEPECTTSRNREKQQQPPPVTPAPFHEEYMKKAAAERLAKRSMVNTVSGSSSWTSHADGPLLIEDRPECAGHASGYGKGMGPNEHSSAEVQTQVQLFMGQDNQTAVKPAQVSAEPLRHSERKRKASSRLQDAEFATPKAGREARKRNHMLKQLGALCEVVANSMRTSKRTKTPNQKYVSD